AARHDIVATNCHMCELIDARLCTAPHDWAAGWRRPTRCDWLYTNPNWRWPQAARGRSQFHGDAAGRWARHFDDVIDGFRQIDVRDRAIANGPGSNLQRTHRARPWH